MSDKRTLVTSFGVFAVFTAAAVLALDFNLTGQWFPLYVSIAGAFLALTVVVGETVRLVRGLPSAGAEPADAVAEAQGDDEDATATEIARTYGYWLLTLISYPVLLFVVGAYIATGVWLPLFLKLQARADWKTTVGGTIAMLLLLEVLRRQLSIEMPPSLLFD